MRRAAKVDANHTAIVETLRACGMEVLSLAAVGDGCADLLVYSKRKARYYMVEVKNSALPPSARKLTPAQVKFHARFPVWIIQNESEAIALAGGKEQ